MIIYKLQGFEFDNVVLFLFKFESVKFVSLFYRGLVYIGFICVKKGCLIIVDSFIFKDMVINLDICYLGFVNVISEKIMGLFEVL